MYLNKSSGKFKSISKMQVAMVSDKVQEKIFGHSFLLPVYFFYNSPGMVKQEIWVWKQEFG